MGSLFSFKLRVKLNYLLIRKICGSQLIYNKMKILNVAEKNDAAKNIAGLLSRGTSRRREGLSPYNKIYEFSINLFNENVTMVMTSVSGHLLNYSFTSAFKNWQACNPLELFDAPVFKSTISEDYEKIKKTLEREIKSCSKLIIWTDCDREGENIGFEVINVCRAIKPNIQVYRAKFSEITSASVNRALRTLTEPDKKVSDAVDVRQELDLRIGAAFTRLQTLRFQQVFPEHLSNNLISYGSCQFPTLGFVVDRYKAIEDFVPQNFWKIKMSHQIDDLTVDFNWSRDRLFNKNFVQVLLDICQERPTATVLFVESKPKNKWRPLPLDTIEMEKNVSRKLKINAKETMSIAEKLYTKGLISYPRTETNIFPKDINLNNLIQQHTANNEWGTFAQKLLDSGGANPRAGNKSDQAHPPIHPIKYADNLNGNEKRLYEFIVRHFLACCSKDAKGFETNVEVDIAGEKFNAKGLMIIERNYLEVYIYEKWNSKEIHIYQVGQTFEPTTLEMAEGTTTAPPLLTEADLIALMEKHGIGTDATHAEHIATIQKRDYVALPDGQHFVPGRLGMGLVEGYDQMNLNVSLAKPNLRAGLESELKKICDGQKDPKQVLEEQIQIYREVYRKVMIQMNLIDEAIGNRLNSNPAQIPNENLFNQGSNVNYKNFAFKCPKCNGNMVISKKLQNPNEFYIKCINHPQCNHVIWLDRVVKSVSILNENCNICGPEFKKLKFEFVYSFGTYSNLHEGCLGGCDMNFLEMLDININKVRRQTNEINNEKISSHNIIPIRNSQNLVNGVNDVNNSNRNINSMSNSSNQNYDRNSRNSNSDNTSVTWGRSDSINASLNSNNLQNNLPNTTVCGCNEPALLLTVRKAGPNNGRKFFKCPKQSDGCNFFLWANEDLMASQSNLNNQDASYSVPSSNYRNSESDNERNLNNDVEVRCGCGEKAVIRTVLKETANKGRSFYVCLKSQNEKCNFFQWTDEAPRSSTNYENRTANNFQRPNNWNNKRGGSKTNYKKRKGNFSNEDSSQPRQRRKCGICGEEGHIRSRCPNKNQ